MSAAVASGVAFAVAVVAAAVANVAAVAACSSDNTGSCRGGFSAQSELSDNFLPGSSTQCDAAKFASPHWV